jgi:hypothetical protein
MGAMFRRLFSAVAVIGATLVGLTAAPRPAAADCGPLKPGEQLVKEAQVVFAGTLVDATLPITTPTNLEAAVYTFSVDTIFKGQLKDSVNVYAMPPTAPDALSAMREGQRYVMFSLIIAPGNPYRPIGTPDNALFSNKCMGVLPFEQDAILPAFLGKGKVPETIITIPPPPSTIPGALVADEPLEDWKKPVGKVLVGLAVVGVAARLLAIRRRTVFR